MLSAPRFDSQFTVVLWGRLSKSTPPEQKVTQHTSLDAAFEYLNKLDDSLKPVWNRSNEIMFYDAADQGMVASLRAGFIEPDHTRLTYAQLAAINAAAITRERSQWHDNSTADLERIAEAGLFMARLESEPGFNRWEDSDWNEVCNRIAVRMDEEDPTHIHLIVKEEIERDP